MLYSPNAVQTSSQVRYPGTGGSKSEGSDGRTQMQEVKCGSSLGSGNDMALTFGVGKASVTGIRVRWPDGTESDHAPANDREVRITYPGP